MAVINKAQVQYTGIGNATLQTGLQLQLGVVPNNAGTISGTSGGVTTLVTVPTGRRYLITGFIFVLGTTVSLTGTAVLSVGTNAATYDNIMPSTTMTNWTVNSRFYHFVPEGAVWVSDAGQNIRLNLTGVFGGTVDFTVIQTGIII